jgi:hypothetical protein
LALISTWRLELPGEFRQFDYDTISDVILHISYTARDGGDNFKGTVNGYVEGAINKWLDELAKDDTGLPGLPRLFSLRHEFPDAFHKLLNPSPGPEQLTEFYVTQKHFPHFSAGKTVEFCDIQQNVVYLKRRGQSS